MQFKTNTGKIWEGGAHDLPYVANDFALKSGTVNGLREGAPQFNSVAAEASMKGLGSEWTTLITDLQNAMAKTSTNMQHTGAALVKFAEEIDDNDTAASNEIDKARKDIMTGQMPVIDPTYPKKK